LLPVTALLPDLEPFQGSASFQALPNSPESASFQVSLRPLDLKKEPPAPVRPPGSVKRPVLVQPQVLVLPRAEAEPVPSEEHRY
jgi:hypothetical protein